mgnify:CR=1 FL=1
MEHSYQYTDKAKFLHRLIIIASLLFIALDVVHISDTILGYFKSLRGTDRRRGRNLCK